MNIPPSLECQPKSQCPTLCPTLSLSWHFNPREAVSYLSQGLILSFSYVGCWGQTFSPSYVASQSWIFSSSNVISQHQTFLSSWVIPRIDAFSFSCLRFQHRIFTSNVNPRSQICSFLNVRFENRTFTPSYVGPRGQVCWPSNVRSQNRRFCFCQSWWHIPWATPTWCQHLSRTFCFRFGSRTDAFQTIIACPKHSRNWFSLMPTCSRLASIDSDVMFVILRLAAAGGNRVVCCTHFEYFFCQVVWWFFQNLQFCCFCAVTDNKKGGNILRSLDQVVVYIHATEGFRLGIGCGQSRFRITYLGLGLMRSRIIGYCIAECMDSRKFNVLAYRVDQVVG